MIGVCFIYLKHLDLSFPRRRESMLLQEWMPASAGMTAMRWFHKINETHPNDLFGLWG